MKKVAIFMVLLTVAFSLPVFAGDINENAQSTDYVIKAPAMLLRGAEGIITSPVEVLAHGYKGTMEGRPLVGTIEGLGEGVVWTLDRAGRGVWDVLTCLAPKYNGAPSTHELHLK